MIGNIAASRLHTGRRQYWKTDLKTHASMNKVSIARSYDIACPSRAATEVYEFVSPMQTPLLRT
ncbi:hypothetical protein [Gluconobacter cerinus]|uniref:hypothetical protein n=1 Tax=Gluconobacter cerinus TaxID=38307 RepID=UPI001C0439C1|nr:hypothetical protein [Gluconobacter cerinus]